jgi:carboxymethylenebutenolidase
MLIKESYRDVPTTADGKKGTMRIFIIEPNLPDYPHAKFPGVVVFSEVSEASLRSQERYRIVFS